MKLFSAPAWLAVLLPLLFCLSSGIAQDRDPQFNFVPATTVQLPVFGVAVDPDGVMQLQQFAPPGGELFVMRARAAIAHMNRDLLKKSPLRKVSLKKLQAAIQEQLDDGLPPTDTMLKLAGLQRVEYVFVYPDQNDVVIVGPAEGWIENADGRAVGITTARPVVLLEDLLTALRVFTPDQPHDIWVGCSIGTTAEGMERLKEFQRSIPARVAQHEREMVAHEVLRGVEAALGNAGVSVFGVHPETNMARVMLEADYRMKLIAIGREPPPIEMPVFFDRLRGAPRNNFQRWWFTPNYQCVEITDDRLAFHMVGQGVGLGTEEYKTDERGRLIEVQTNPLRAARLYAEAFTRDYAEIAAASPVFGQLRNMIDVLIVANYLQREDLFARAGLDIGLLLDNDKISVNTMAAPTQARCMANVAWKGSRLVAPSGGVCILASEAFKPEYLMQV
ncbi:MAG: DUF1598 domain-containing protein, partial [Pirellulaceae bacterium]